MNNLPLQPLVWSDCEPYEIGYIENASTISHSYIVASKDDKFVVIYYLLAGGHSKRATGFATIDEAKQWSWNHYNEKMQPYVKPSPTKVFELTYDCGDSYITLFMTTDKQTALDFIESVQVHDAGFAKWHGINNDADEAIADRYNDTHPLKPYASKIFEPIYEDSFSEWAISYAGNSLVSQMSIIEHELFSTMQNNKGE